MTAIAGGTVSSISGGKFANGAVSGAFVMMFNDMAHEVKYISPMSKAELKRLSASIEEPGLVDVSEVFVPVGRIFASIANTFKAAFLYIRLAPYSSKIVTQMKKRGWTNERVFEALKTNGIEATGKLNSATRYEHPILKQSIIIDNKNKELFHVGGKNFEY
jgi:hypothetical protein